MLCGFCCLISRTRGRRACIITSAAAPALSSISGLLSRKITSPAEQWNVGSVLRANAFLLWLLWTSYWKDQELLQGFEELQTLPREAVSLWLGLRERNLMILGQRDVQLHFISSLLPKKVRSGEREGWIIKAALAGGFIFEEFFLPVGIFWCSIFFPWTSWQVLHCSGSVVAESACVWIPEEGVTKCASGFAVYAFLEPHFLLRVSALLSFIKPLIIHTTQPH